MLPFASAHAAVTSPKPALERATAFYDRLPSVPEYPFWLHTAQSTTPYVPPLTTLPTFTTATPRPAVLPLPGTGGTHTFCPTSTLGFWLSAPHSSVALVCGTAPYLATGTAHPVVDYGFTTVIYTRATHISGHRGCARALLGACCF